MFTINEAHPITVFTLHNGSRADGGTLQGRIRGFEECDPTSLLRKCSKKLMVKTIRCFKTKLKSALEEFTSTHDKLRQQFPEKDSEISSKLESRVNRQREILSNRRINKFRRDGLDPQESRDFSEKMLQELIHGENRPTAIENKRNEETKILSIKGSDC